MDPFRSAAESLGGPVGSICGACRGPRKLRYLTDPVLRNVSLKVRGGVRFDVKAFRHSPGQLALPAESEAGWRCGRSGASRWTMPAIRCMPARPGRESRRLDGDARSDQPRTVWWSGPWRTPTRRDVHWNSPKSRPTAKYGGRWPWKWSVSLRTCHRDLQAVAMTFINDPLSARFGLDTTASMSSTSSGSEPPATACNTILLGQKARGLHFRSPTSARNRPPRRAARSGRAGASPRPDDARVAGMWRRSPVCGGGRVQPNHGGG